MNYQTKYDIGNRVWGLSSDYTCKIVPCVTCQELGTVMIGEEKFMCPKCEGKSAHPQYAGHKWVIRTEGIIGKITIDHMPERYREEDPEMEIQYMLDSTGVGSGQVWKEKDLFLSRDLAQEECDKRNGIIDWADKAELKPGFKDQFGGWRNLQKQ